MPLFIGRAEDLGDVRLHALFQYRASVFHGALGWDIPLRNGVDQDRWDHPDLHPIHVVDQAAGHAISGCARLLPTTASYMLRDLPAFHPLLDAPPPSSAAIWEISRLTAYSVHHRRADPRATARLLRALLEFAVWHGIETYLCVVEPRFARRLQRLGIPLVSLGPQRPVGGVEAAAFEIPIDDRTAAAVRRIGDDGSQRLFIGESLSNPRGAAAEPAFTAPSPESSTRLSTASVNN